MEKLSIDDVVSTGLVTPAEILDAIERGAFRATLLLGKDRLRFPQEAVELTGYSRTRLKEKLRAHCIPITRDGTGTKIISKAALRRAKLI